MFIRRQITDAIKRKMFKGKAIVMVGARQVGKSTLFKQIIEGEKSTLVLNCDEPEVRELLTDANTQTLRLLIADNRIVVIDEAQRVERIGLTLKLIVENFPSTQLLVTGSSSFELKNNLNEPLTGRKYEYYLYPISTQEIIDNFGLLMAKQQLEPRMIYGSYPEIINKPEEAKELLTGLTDSYLYKDILSLDNVRRPALLNKLLIALALQIGSEVSYNELAKAIGSDNKTVERYIGLLEKCYVIFTLPAFSRNLRNELKKSKKIYFYDTGIRNAVLQNFAPLALRQDVGSLWENYFIAERIKHNNYTGNRANCYFWRTTTQQEIDYIEESDGTFSIFEIKWNEKRAKTPFPATFTSNYPLKNSVVITPGNYTEWLYI